MRELSVLFFGKEDNKLTVAAVVFLKRNFKNVRVFLGNRRQAFPLKKSAKTWDLVISYLSPWIIPEWVLENARVAAINFHPGPPEYPGIGCTNFAIYQGAKRFGVTCHHMAAKVDTGKIIAVRRFPLNKSDGVYTLTQRCYKAIAGLFFEIMTGVFKGQELPVSSEAWKRKPFLRKQLNDLCIVTEDMDAAEIKRRVKATTFPGMPGAYVIRQGKKFLAVKSLGKIPRLARREKDFLTSGGERFIAEERLRR